MNSFRLFAPTIVLVATTVSLSAQDKIDFKTQVLPIIENSCLSCHTTAHTDAGKVKRPKGGVAMDTKAGFEKGKKGKPLVVAGKPDDSLMYHLVSLPVDDEDHMPPQEKKEPLTDKELATVKQWIEQGASFGDWVGKAPEGAVADTGGPEDRDARGPRDNPFQNLAKGVKPLAADVLTKAAGTKAKIEPLGTTPLLRVSFSGHEDEVTDADIALLAPLENHLVMASLGKTKITDAACATLAKMKKLVRLDVRETGITDKGLGTVSALPELQMLNLFGTKVTDAGIAGLGKSPKLARLYVWQTGVSEAAVEQLKKALPKLQVSFTADMPEGRGPESGGKRGRGEAGKGKND